VRAFSFSALRYRCAFVRTPAAKAGVRDQVTMMSSLAARLAAGLLPAQSLNLPVT
jgi:hypothetical protein